MKLLLPTAKSLTSKKYLFRGKSISWSLNTVSLLQLAIDVVKQTLRWQAKEVNGCMWKDLKRFQKSNKQRETEDYIVKRLFIIKSGKSNTVVIFLCIKTDL